MFADPGLICAGTHVGHWLGDNESTWASLVRALNNFACLALPLAASDTLKLTWLSSKLIAADFTTCSDLIVSLLAKCTGVLSARHHEHEPVRTALCRRRHLRCVRVFLQNLLRVYCSLRRATDMFVLFVGVQASTATPLRSSALAGAPIFSPLCPLTAILSPLALVSLPPQLPFPSLSFPNFRPHASLLLFP
jgi:hypothetical protein